MLQTQQMIEPVDGTSSTWFEGVGRGVFATWLRWCDKVGNLIPTGAEQKKALRQQAEAETARLQAKLAQLRSATPNTEKGD